MSTTKNGFTVNKRKVNELMKDPNWSKDPGLSEKVMLARYEVYVHTDGRILCLSGGLSGYLYLTRDAFLPIAEQIAAMRPGVTHHILEGRLPEGKDFIEHVPQLIDHLALLLLIPRTELNNNLSSLEKLDRKVKHLGRRKCLEAPIFSALVAYVGEVMRQSTSGKWEMRLHQDSTTWEPWIIDPQGRSCNPFIIVYDQLAEQHPFSIYGATIGAIESRYRVSDKPPRRVASYFPNSDPKDKS